MELRGPPRSPAISEREAGTLLHALLDAGITLIDTSIDYGLSEERIGRHLADRRDKCFLATKCGCPVGDLAPDAQMPYPHDYSPWNVRAGVEQSLRRLRTDHLDLVQVHMTPSRETLAHEGTVETLIELRDAGMIRFIGMSGTLPHLPDHITMGVFDVFQIPYSLVQREHEELIERAAASGAGVIVRGGAARGAPTAEKGWDRGPTGMAEGEAARRWRAADVDGMIGDMSELEFVIRFTLSNPAITAAIVGTSSLDHLAGNVAIAQKGPLPPKLYAEARRRFARECAPF
jgi:aryl-alcohol dehydrogenase-like predicted oxidoreductase